MGHAAQTKNLIITEALSLFNTKGYRATSLSDITNATGMTKGAIYGNFANKDAVAVASFDYAIKKVLDDLTERIRNQPSAPLKLKAILTYYKAYIEEPPIHGGCPIINTSVEADDQYPQLKEKAAETILTIKSALKKIILRGIKEQQIREGIDADLYANMFYATVSGALLIARVEGKCDSFDQVKKGLEMQINAITIK